MDVVAHSALLERCYTALLSAAIEPTIITSFVRAGIIPIMKGGEVISLEIEADKLIHGQWSIMEENYEDKIEAAEEKKKEKAKRIKLKYVNWGIMNAEQKKLQAEGRCPYCGTPLPNE